MKLIVYILTICPIEGEKGMVSYVTNQLTLLRQPQAFKSRCSGKVHVMLNKCLTSQISTMFKELVLMIHY